MAFLYAFSAPRTKPLHFEQLHHTSLASGILNAAVSFFSSKPASSSPAAAAPPANAAVTTADGSAAGAPTAASSANAPVDLRAQLVPASPQHNLALASQARSAVLTSLLLHTSIDPNAMRVRLAALRAYLPFIRTIVAQLDECDEAERTRIEKSGQILEWSSVVQAGARPNAKDVVPFFKRDSLELHQELGHAYFTLAIALYQHAGTLSFHALQMANSIPACSFLHLMPAEAAAAQRSASASDAAPAPPRRMFNPLSYVAPPPAASPSAPAPKSASEIGEIRASLIAKRKEAVEALRTAAGIFDYLATEYWPSLPVPQSRMIDTMPAVSEAMKILCLVHCQQHTLLSALLQAAGPNPPSTTLLAKLLQGVIDQTTLVRSTLQSGTGSWYNALEPSLHHLMRVTIAYARALRLGVLGVAAENAQEHGRALALLGASAEAMAALCSNDPATGLALSAIRDCNPVLSELKHEAALEGTRIEKALVRLRRDNDSIYFAPVPKLDVALVEAGDPPADSGDTPPSVFMPTPLPYTPPPLLQALFLATPNAEAWTSGSGGAGSEGSSASAAFSNTSAR